MKKFSFLSTLTITGAYSLCGKGAEGASGKSTLTPWLSKGAVIIKIINNTNITSM